MRPTSLPNNQIALNGNSAGYSSDYSLETYDIPESRRDEINYNITQAQLSKEKQSLVVEVKVDAQCRAVPVSFWVDDRQYPF